MVIYDFHSENMFLKKIIRQKDCNFEQLCFLRKSVLCIRPTMYWEKNISKKIEIPSLLTVFLSIPCLRLILSEFHHGQKPPTFIQKLWGISVFWISQNLNQNKLCKFLPKEVLTTFYHLHQDITFLFLLNHNSPILNGKR